MPSDKVVVLEPWGTGSGAVVVGGESLARRRTPRAALGEPLVLAVLSAAVRLDEELSEVVGAHTSRSDHLQAQGHCR